MSLATEPFGHWNGQPVPRYILQNTGGVRAVLMPYGATLLSLTVPAATGPVELTLGFDTFEEYLTRSPYFGCTVGRFANRIANGRFTLLGRSYMLARNENGRHHLHGGLRGFDKQLWASEPFERPGQRGVRFSRVSPDGEEGYPGRLSVAVTFTLTDDHVLECRYEAETDQPTPLNLTNHTYWNLAGSGTILDHELRLAAEAYLPVDETLIPVGPPAPVAGTPMDFRTFHRIGERIHQVPGGYDHCYVLRSSPSPEPVLAAELRDPVSGRTLQIETTEPGLQFYSGNFLDNLPGRGGTIYPRHGGLCLETQHFPDSPNRPDFPSCILRPGERFVSVTRHRLGF